eukprot:Platyproteum_vivax@DN3605_c0_g1_i1.p3
MPNGLRLPSIVAQQGVTTRTPISTPMMRPDLMIVDAGKVLEVKDPVLEPQEVGGWGEKPNPVSPWGSRVFLEDFTPKVNSSRMHAKHMSLLKEVEHIAETEEEHLRRGSDMCDEDAITRTFKFLNLEAN